MHKFMHTYMHTYMQSGRGRRSGSVRVPTRHPVDTDAVQRCARAHTLYLHTSMHTHPFRPPSICIHAYLHTCMHTYAHMHTFMQASMHTEEAPRTEHPLTDGRYWDQIQDCRPNSRLSVWCSPPRVAPGRRTRQSFRACRRAGRRVAAAFLKV